MARREAELARREAQLAAAGGPSGGVIKVCVVVYVVVAGADVWCAGSQRKGQTHKQQANVQAAAVELVGAAVMLMVADTYMHMAAMMLCCAACSLSSSTTPELAVLLPVHLPQHP